MFAKIHEYLETLPNIYIAIISLAIVMCLGFIDFSIGPEISFSVFYILPILISTWYANKIIGVLTSISQ